MNFNFMKRGVVYGAILLFSGQLFASIPSPAGVTGPTAEDQALEPKQARSDSHFSDTNNRINTFMDAWENRYGFGISLLGTMVAFPFLRFGPGHDANARLSPFVTSIILFNGLRFLPRIVVGVARGAWGCISGTRGGRVQSKTTSEGFSFYKLLENFISPSVVALAAIGAAVPGTLDLSSEQSPLTESITGAVVSQPTRNPRLRPVGFLAGSEGEEFYGHRLAWATNRGGGAGRVDLSLQSSANNQVDLSLQSPAEGQFQCLADILVQSACLATTQYYLYGFGRNDSVDGIVLCRHCAYVFCPKCVGQMLEVGPRTFRCPGCRRGEEEVLGFPSLEAFSTAVGGSCTLKEHLVNTGKIEGEDFWMRGNELQYECPICAERRRIR